MYSNDPLYDDTPILDEHAIQLTAQHYRDGESDLYIEDMQRKRHQVTPYLFT